MEIGVELMLAQIVFKDRMSTITVYPRLPTGLKGVMAMVWFLNGAAISIILELDNRLLADEYAEVLMSNLTRRYHGICTAHYSNGKLYVCDGYERRGKNGLLWCDRHQEEEVLDRTGEEGWCPSCIEESDFLFQQEEDAWKGYEHLRHV